MKKRSIQFDPADFEPVKAIALLFPGAEESVSHDNTPSVKVRGKLMCRLHETGAFIAIHLDFEIRDRYLDSHPEIFLLPDHYKNYPYICMLTNGYSQKLLKQVLEASWRGLASKKQQAEWDASKK